ncbi:hypothetical protein VTI28DRAFT_7791 [Corynascus sepedonium]
MQAVYNAYTLEDAIDEAGWGTTPYWMVKARLHAELEVAKHRTAWLGFVTRGRLCPSFWRSHNVRAVFASGTRHACRHHTCIVFFELSTQEGTKVGSPFGAIEEEFTGAVSCRPETWQTPCLCRRIAVLQDGEPEQGAAILHLGRQLASGQIGGGDASAHHPTIIDTLERPRRMV